MRTRWHRSAPSILAWTLMGILVSGSVGCGSVPDAASDSELIAPGEPSVEVGYYAEDDYQPLSVTAEARVLWGTQGGTWTMPSVRIRGIASPTLVSGTLVLAPDTDSSEVLGSSERELQFVRIADGSLESRAVAVPVQHAPPRQFESITDLYGQAALLTMTASDAQGRSATSSTFATLVED